MRYVASILLGVLLLPMAAFALTADERATLERKLDETLAEIDELEGVLGGYQRQSATLEREVAILDAQIRKAQLQIEARTLEIRRLNTNIAGKEETLDTLSLKLRREKESLAQILRKSYKLGDYSTTEILLSQESVSDFFGNLDDFTSIKAALHVSFDEIADTQQSTSQQKEVLTDRRAEELELRNIQELERQKIAGLQAQKEQLLAETQGQEDLYQALVSNKKRTAAQIRSTLFALRDSTAIPFGDALEHAQQASNGTGVRAALILGVLKQETRLGEFLGTGAWQVDMHPTRDQPVFRQIAPAIGFDPDSVPVSKAPSYGWGGAMGPSQFIPSTWVCYGGFINTRTGDCNNAQRSLSWDNFWQGPWEYRANEDRIRAAIGGDDPSNPYENEDAFTATALLMKDNGADKGGWSAERLAALRYFAGWANASNPSYAFYGDSVMGHAADFQEQINILSGS